MKLKTILITATLCATPLIAVPMTASAQTLAPISVSGNHLIANGQNIQLRGVNETGTEYECITDSTSAFDEPQDSTATFNAMHTWGINAVRIPLNEDCWLGINGMKYSGAEYQTAIENYVTDLENNGFYPIINLHFSAPGTTKATGQEPMADQDHSPAFWTSVAGAFKNDNHVLFDLYNEPYPNNNTDNATAWSCVLNGGTCAHVSFQAAGMQELLNDVRNAGATVQPVMVGGPEYAGVIDSWEQYLPTDPDHSLVASIHIYSNPLGSPCNTQSCWNSQIAGVDSTYPVVIGEFGDTETACESTFSQSLMNWADTQSSSVSYMAWAWTAGGGCAAEPALLSNFANATPTAYGSGVEAHYQADEGGGGQAAPAVTTNAATGITTSGATLNGTVNPEGASTTYQFQYGTTTSYGSVIPASPGSAGSGTTAVNENATLSGLSASTTYHYRITATNSAGTTYGADQQFTTSAGTQNAPVVSTSAATSITSTGATLNGTVNPEGASTTYQFDYGTTTGYGTSVPVPAGSAGSGSSSVNESYALTGLSASTTYHYRIEATNSGGTTFGADQQFTTSSGGGCSGGTISKDSSTPAVVHSGYGDATVATASFSPPACSLVEVVVNALQGAPGGDTITVTDSHNDTFTAGPHIAGADAPNSAWIFYTYENSAPGSITVTAHQSGSNAGTMQLAAYVLDGANPTQTGAASGTYDSGSTSTTAQNHSLTTTQTGSWVLVAVGNGDSGSSLTPLSTTSNIDVWQDSSLSGNDGAIGVSASATGTPGATTFGWTGSNSDQFIWAAQEILP